MSLLCKFILLLSLGLSLGQSRSVWKRYSHVPGTLNCRKDAEIINRLTSAAFEHMCIARIANNTDIYPGFLVAKAALTTIYFVGEERSGDWFSQNNLEEVEVLDVDPSVLSWIPIAFNPSESVLIEPEVPYSTLPKRFICRPSPYLFTSDNDRTSYVAQIIGFMRGRTCYAGWYKEKFESNFEVLALNERAKMFYDYGYSGPGVESKL